LTNGLPTGKALLINQKAISNDCISLRYKFCFPYQSPKEIKEDRISFNSSIVCFFLDGLISLNFNILSSLSLIRTKNIMTELSLHSQSKALHRD